MKEKIKNYQSNAIGIIVGVIICSIGPLSLIFTKLTHRSMLNEIYFLSRVLPFLYGTLLTDFLICFVAGFAAALISKRHKLISSIAVGIIAPITSVCILRRAFGYGWGEILFEIMSGQTLFNIIMVTVYALLGGLFYTKVVSRFTKKT